MSTGTEKREFPPPIISGDPPQIHEPLRVGSGKSNVRDKFRRVNVADYYVFAATYHNNVNSEKPDIQILTFQDDLTSRRRNEMHKRIISDILMDRVPELYGEMTYSQARLKEWKRMKEVVEEISDLPEFELYKKHSKHRWMIRRLIDQRMETRCRAKRNAVKRENQKSSGACKIEDKRSSANIPNQSKTSEELYFGKESAECDKPEDQKQNITADKSREDGNEIARAGSALTCVPDIEEDDNKENKGDENEPVSEANTDQKHDQDRLKANRARITMLREELSKLEAMESKEGETEKNMPCENSTSGKRKPSTRGRGGSARKLRRR